MRPGAEVRLAGDAYRDLRNTSSFDAPLPRSFRWPPDRLDLGVLVEPGDAVLPPNPAGLESSEGHLGAVWWPTVDTDEPGAQLARNLQRALTTSRHHVPG